MNKLLLCVLCVFALFAAVAPCFADTVNGVLAEERVVNLAARSGQVVHQRGRRSQRCPLQGSPRAGSTAIRAWPS